MARTRISLTLYPLASPNSTSLAAIEIKWRSENHRAYASSPITSLPSDHFPTRTITLVDRVHGCKVRYGSPFTKISALPATSADLRLKLHDQPRSPTGFVLKSSGNLRTKSHSLPAMISNVPFCVTAAQKTHHLHIREWRVQ